MCIPKAIMKTQITFSLTKQIKKQPSKKLKRGFWIS